MGKIISIAVPKGGVGKTTTAVNLAASLSIAEKKTLLLDVDNAGACSIALGYTPEKIRGDIFNVFSFTKSLEQVIHKTDIPNLDFIPSRIESYENEERMGRLSENKTLLRTLLKIEIYSYDYIIIDCPPYLHGMTTNALLASDSVLLPTKAGRFSLHAVNKILNHVQWIRTLGNRGLQIEGILLTMDEPNTKVSIMALKELKNLYPNYLLNTTIPKNTTITEASFNGKPAILYNAMAKGSQAYLHLAQEIINRRNIESSLIASNL